MHAMLSSEPTARPAPQYPPDGLAAIIVKLLDEAGKALDVDRAAARICIDQASALLRAERDSQDQPAPRPDAPGTRSGLAPWQIRRVKAHIEAHLHTTVRARELAGLSRLSPSYFATAFKRSFGESPRAYLVRQRLERAQHMMLTTDHPLSHIALACGFADQAHLSRRFRQSTGGSPSAWRRARYQQIG
jgi:AraC family transcriptional regulator